MEENGSAPGTGEAKRSAAAPADPEVVDRPLRRGLPDQLPRRAASRRRPRLELSTGRRARRAEVDKLHAICVVCGDLATRNQRLIDGKPAPAEGPTIQVGGSESYEARCRKCHEVPQVDRGRTVMAMGDLGPDEAARAQ